MSAELVPAYSQAPAIKQWTNEQLEMATRSFAADCNNAELEVFVESCHRKGLDPWLGQIVAIKRKGKMIIQETIEGYRAIAERSGLYGGYRGPWWRSADGDWDEVWLGEGPPAAAKIVVFRKDWQEPAPGVASWSSNAQFYWDKDTKQSKLVQIWADRPDEMLAKCAEVRALKRAFTKEFALAGLNVRDLSDAQIVTVEARAAGLDDEGRHAMIAEVTGGRTDSSRDLTDDERLDVRGEVARRRAEQADEEPGPVRTVTQTGPNGDVTLYVDTETGQTMSDDEGRRRELMGRIKRDVVTLTADLKAEFDQYRRDCGIDPATKSADYTLEQLELCDAWFDNTIGGPY